LYEPKKSPGRASKAMLISAVTHRVFDTPKKTQNWQIITAWVRAYLGGIS